MSDTPASSMAERWHTQLATAKEVDSIFGGYSGGPAARLPKLADKVFPRHPLPGPTLTVYMLRRFGFPNTGSDPYKDLCEWTLTTPMPGIFLAVYPRMGTSNLHFGIRYSKKAEALLEADPERDKHLQRLDDAVSRWWNRTGKKKYLLCTATPQEFNLVHPYDITLEKDGEEGIGLWERDGKLPSHYYTSLGRPGFTRQMIVGWLVDWLRGQGVRMPKWRKQARRGEYTAIQRQAQKALMDTMRDLLFPTYIGGLHLNAYGDVDRNRIAMLAYHRAIPARQRAKVPYYEHAGDTPEYIFGPQPKTKARKKKK